MVLDVIYALLAKRTVFLWFVCVLFSKRKATAKIIVEWKSGRRSQVHAGVTAAAAAALLCADTAKCNYVCNTFDAPGKHSFK